MSPARTNFHTSSNKQSVFDESNSPMNDAVADDFDVGRFSAASIENNLLSDEATDVIVEYDEIDADECEDEFEIKSLPASSCSQLTTSDSIEFDSFLDCCMMLS
jgi:hypothetical protein